LEEVMSTKPQEERFNLLGLPDDPYATPAHPCAELFPLMPDDELHDLAADIKKKGLVYTMIVQDGMILDGRNRLKACKLAGVKGEDLKFIPCETDPLEFVLSCNLHRRHLTPAQRREVIAAVLKQRPEKSDRQVAKQTQTDHKTAGGSARADGETWGNSPRRETRG
jgi:hypothetical protein